MLNRKSSYRFVFFAIAMLFMSIGASTALSQVTVTGSTGANGAYTELNLAFTAINGAGTQAGNNILVEVSANTTEAASAILNASDWTTLTVRPTAVATVSGTITGAIIKLNGADNVTIDGRIGGVGTNRDLTVQNNSTAAATAAVWLASVIAGNGAANNTIRNLELRGGTDTSVSGSSTFGIIMAGTTISTTANGVDNDNNSFIANRITKVRYGIVTRGTTTDLNINPVVTDNIIGPAAFGTDQINKMGILMQADTGATVSRNLIQSVGCLVSQTCTGSDRLGIGIGSESWSGTDTTGTITSLNYTVTQNTIRDVIEDKTFSAVGIKLGTTQSGGATNNLVANNFIINVRANGTAGDQMVGIGIAGGNGDVIANNSISLYGDVDPGAATASTVYGNGIRIPGANAANNANFTIRNNSIYIDLSSSSTAALRFYAITLNSNAYSFGTGSLNNNNYYINAANPQLQTGGLSTTTANTTTTQFAALVDWQAALTAPQDAASIQANPLYASNSTDLHLTGPSPNINVGATIAAVPVDIDNQARPNGPNYDIGADEFYAAPGVLQLSSATYGGNEGTVLAATATRISGSSGVVGATYTLTDGTGTGGGACGVGVDYVNPGPQLLVFGDTVTSQPINVTLCGDAVVDPAETFTITLSLPTGGATLGSPTVATATITHVPPPFSGTYTVGGGGNYPSLTNPGGIFEALNLAGATGNVVINITSDLAGETGTHPLNEIAGGFTVLIKPSGAPRTITGSINGGLIRLFGADNVRIDGSTAASFVDNVVGGTIPPRELTIQNTNVGTSNAVVVVQSGATGAQNNTIQNVNVLGQDPTTTLIGIALGGNTIGTAGTDNDGNRVINCTVRRATFGIYSAGLSAANQNTGTIISENDIGGATGDRVRRVGILVFNEDGISIDQNRISGIETLESADAIGIAAGIQLVDTTNVASGAITNANISRNRIIGVNSASTIGFSAAGISIAGGTTGANTISNNLISGVTSPGTAPDFPTGIFVAGVVGSTTRLYYNSVSMTGDRDPLVAGQAPGFGIAITGTDPTVELKNNIFYTTQTASGGGVNALSYAIGMATATFANLDSDFNVFFSTGANDGGFRIGSLAEAAGTSHVDVAAWNVATGDDATSVTIGEVDPLFYNPLTDPHLLATSPARNVGTPIMGIVIDHDGNPRPNPLDGLVVQVDIGGDEALAPVSAEVTIGGRVMTSGGNGIRNAILTVSGGTLQTPIQVRTGSFGYYSVEGLDAGETYVITIHSKRYIFGVPNRVITATDSVNDIDFVADPQ